MSITDLTGTKWRISNVTTQDFEGTKTFTGSISDGTHTISGSLTYYCNTWNATSYIGNIYATRPGYNFVWDTYNKTGTFFSYIYNSRSQSGYAGISHGTTTSAGVLTISFTGGASVTDSQLIAWVEANGEQIPTNITLDLSTIGLPAGSHLIQIKLSDDGVTKADSELSNGVTYVEPEPLPQLDTPTNLTADGTNIEFDEVENAEEYEIFADGVSIGTHTPVVWEYPEEDGDNLIIRQAYNVTTDGDDIIE